jgi:hypothetical protein
MGAKVHPEELTLEQLAYFFAVATKRVIYQGVLTKKEPTDEEFLFRSPDDPKYFLKKVCFVGLSRQLKYTPYKYMPWNDKELMMDMLNQYRIEITYSPSNYNPPKIMFKRPYGDDSAAVTDTNLPVGICRYVVRHLLGQEIELLE